MTSGGARVRPGPAPNPNALRREHDAGEWTHLPEAGREGDPPPWPLSRRTRRESVLWAREWRRPQAVMWERNGQCVEVAIYVRTLALAERQDAPVNARTLLKQQMEALGVSIPGMLRLRWIIGDAPVNARRPQAAAEPGAVVDIRDRFRAVNS